MGKRGPRVNLLSERTEKRFGDEIRQYSSKVTPRELFPDYPSDLPPHGQVYWLDHAPFLHQNGDLNPLTLQAFTELCRLIHERIETRDLLLAEGRTLKTGKIWRLHPLVTHEKDLSKRIFEYEKSFGLLPSQSAFGKSFVPQFAGLKDDADPFDPK